MSIRTRIAGAAVLLVVAVALALSAAVIVEVRAAVDQRALDEIETVSVSLRAVAKTQVGRVQSGRGPTQYRVLRSGGLPNPAGLSARLTLREQELPLPIPGTLPSGLALPTDLADWAGAPARRVGSDDGDRWVSVQEVRNGALLVVAVDTRFGDELVTGVVRSVILVGVIVVVMAGAAAWATVRRELRPLESLADAADEIAAGDLAHRAPDARPSSEVGRVSVSVNRMVDALARAVEVEEASRVRAERFAADAAHELRTPTTAILGYAQLGATQGPWPEERNTEMWEAVVQQATRLRDLVEQLLEIQRVADPDTTLPTPEWFDLTAFVGSVARDSMVIDPTHPIRVESPGPCWINAPRTPIGQVVGNLVANVRAHTPAGTEAAIDVVSEPERIALVVTDNGPGIPAEFRTQVFDRLVRLPGTTAPGSGLGLAIVAANVGRLGGSVEFEPPVSSAPGTGRETRESTGLSVRVALPFRAQPAPPAGTAIGI